MTINPKILQASKGSQLGAIIRCAYGIERDAMPRFEGKASVTSDGYVMCNFVARNGDHHMGAFVGDMADFERNVEGIAKHCALDADERKAFLATMRGWIGTDWRS